MSRSLKENRAFRDREDAAKADTSQEDSSSGTSSPQPMKFRICNYDIDGKKGNSRKRAQHTSSEPERDERGSMIWDIERSNHVHSSLANSPGDEGRQSRIAGKADTACERKNSKNAKTRAHERAEEGEDRESPNCRSSSRATHSEIDELSTAKSPSLRPSQSASQVPPIASPERDVTSKYFAGRYALKGLPSDFGDPSPMNDPAHLKTVPDVHRQQRVNGPDDDVETRRVQATSSFIPPSPVQPESRCAEPKRSMKCTDNDQDGETFLSADYTLSNLMDDYGRDEQEDSWSLYTPQLQQPAEFDDSSAHAIVLEDESRRDDFDVLTRTPGPEPEINVNYTFDNEDQYYQVAANLEIFTDVDDFDDDSDAPLLLQETLDDAKLQDGDDWIPEDALASAIDSEELMEERTDTDQFETSPECGSATWSVEGSESVDSSGGMMLGAVGELENDIEFLRGRELLLGISEESLERSSDVVRMPEYQTVFKAEESVAKRLKGHWLPQKF